MRTEEWQKGMENEAASVADAGWAREARQAAQQEKRRKILIETLGSLGASLALAALWMTGLVLVSRSAWHMDSNPFGAWANASLLRFDLMFCAMLLTTGLLLGLRGVRPGIVALALSLLPVLLWLIGTSIQIQGTWTDPETNMATSYTTDFAVFRLDTSRLNFSFGAALFGFLSTWAGLSLRRKVAHSHHR